MSVGISCCAGSFAHAANTCGVSATGVAFAAYNPTSAVATSGTGTVTVTCGVGVLTSWSVLLNTGSSNSYAARLMKNGTDSLQYNLYLDAAHSTVWGDGTAGTGTSNQPTALIALGGVSYTVYGVIAALQDKAAGMYADTITITLNYN